MKYRTVKIVGGGEYIEKLPETPEEIAEAEKHINAPDSEYYDGFSGYQTQQRAKQLRKRKNRAA